MVAGVNSTRHSDGNGYYREVAPSCIYSKTPSVSCSVSKAVSMGVIRGGFYLSQIYIIFVTKL